METSAENVQQQFDDWLKAAKVLIDDITETIKGLRSNDSQYWRRTFVRSLSSWFEFEIWHYKQLTFILSQSGTVRLPISEIALLNDEQYDLKSNGEVKSRPKLLRVADNLRFAIRTFKKVSLSEAKVEFNGPGWNSFLQSVEIRNRIVHPKCHEDANVSDDDLKNLYAAHDWFKTTIVSLGDKIDATKLLSA